MTDTPDNVTPFRARSPVPGEPLEEPARPNGHDRSAEKLRLFVVTPLASRPGAPVALAEGHQALGPLQAALPPDWLPAAFPEGRLTEIDWAPLFGRRPVIVPRNNIPGAARAARIEMHLRSLGIQASILALPQGLPDGWCIDRGMPDGCTLFFEPQKLEQLGPAFSAVDLAAVQFPELKWVVEGWLPIGLGLLVGPPKIGKSWLAMDFAVKIARGQQVFDKINTFQTDVLYLALEDPPRRLAARMEKVLAGAPAPSNLTFWTQCEKLDQGGMDKIKSYLDAVPSTGLVMVDTWAKVRGEPKSQKGVYNVDYDDVGVLHKLANEREISLLMIHHTRKQDATDVFDTISGSQGVAGAADTLMVLRRPRGSPTGEFHITGRDIQEDGEFAVKFDKESCRWIFIGEAKVVKRETEGQRVYDCLFAATAPMTSQAIADEIEMSTASVRTTLQRLKKKKAAFQVEHGLWGITGRDYDKPI